MKLIDRINYKLFGFQPTFSQCGEDIILAHLFRQLKKDTIRFLDIGANDPVKFSNTFLFYRSGSSGVCIEPNPTLCKQLQTGRKRDLCLNVGIGKDSSGELDFYVMNPHTLSTFNKKDVDHLIENTAYTIEKIIRVPLLSFNDIMIAHFLQQPPDLVSIDVEGLNEDIVEGIDLTKYRPTVFCIETISFSATNQQQYKLDPIFKKMLANDYELYADTCINSIFIDKRNKSF
ncbi:MAG TPA: FkbM family methyltransferase [Ferruginibacter sp.]|jgi:FkbM family methyltransferase|nr:FkbM family methyltransferase [Ferruginibacter sp.]